MIHRALIAAVALCVSLPAPADQNEPSVWEAGVGDNSCWSLLRVPSIESGETPVVITAYLAKLHGSALSLLVNYPGLERNDLIFEVSFFSLGELSLTNPRIDGMKDSLKLRPKQVVDAEKGRAAFYLIGKEAESVRSALENGTPPYLSVTIGGTRSEKRSLNGARAQVSFAMLDACAKTMSPNQPLHPDALTRAGERRR